MENWTRAKCTQTHFLEMPRHQLERKHIVNHRVASKARVNRKQIEKPKRKAREKIASGDLERQHPENTLLPLDWNFIFPLYPLIAAEEVHVSHILISFHIRSACHSYHSNQSDLQNAHLPQANIDP
jgi:hypothetical protein